MNLPNRVLETLVVVASHLVVAAAAVDFPLVVQEDLVKVVVSLDVEEEIWKENSKKRKIVTETN